MIWHGKKNSYLLTFWTFQVRANNRLISTSPAPGFIPSPFPPGPPLLLIRHAHSSSSDLLLGPSAQVRSDIAKGDWVLPYGDGQGVKIRAELVCHLSTSILHAQYNGFCSDRLRNFLDNLLHLRYKGISTVTDEWNILTNKHMKRLNTHTQTHTQICMCVYSVRQR